MELRVKRLVIAVALKVLWNLLKVALNVIRVAFQHAIKVNVDSMKISNEKRELLEELAQLEAEINSKDIEYFQKYKILCKMDVTEEELVYYGISKPWDG